ncbi:MAG TPA: amidohydrolase family protein [Thermoanaerobaculia bacterium]|nr:amidohydrolase family protein [Thermoanaerobaculia bacterium]
MAIAARITLLLLAVPLLLVSCASGPQPIAFVHASVIPMDGERVLRDHTVLVEGRTIVAVGPSATVRIPARARRIDAQGRYLLPALADMHVHQVTAVWGMMLPAEARVPNDRIPYERFLFPYIANGVTLVQELSATAEDIALRNRIRDGELLGPRMILAPMIDGPQKAWPPPLSTWVATPDEARAAVRRAKADGCDKIKVYSFLSRESYDAIVDEAKKLGMDVIGHVPMELSVEYVLDAGQKLIAHSEELAKHTDGDYSAARIDMFANQLARRGVWLVPTLVTTTSILEQFDDAAKVLARPEAVYYNDPLQQGVWTFVSQNLYGTIPPEARERLRNDFEKFQLPLVRSLHQKGGKLLAGSDSILPGLVPGFALHRELRELVGAGLTPYEALRTATVNPFEYLGESDRAGTIATGKQSDLLLVDANPLEDIAAASRVAGVLVRGRWIGEEEIRVTMASIAGEK